MPTSELRMASLGEYSCDGKSRPDCAAEAATHNRRLAEFAMAGKLPPVASTKAKDHCRSHSHTGIAQIAAPQIVVLALV